MIILWPLFYKFKQNVPVADCAQANDYQNMVLAQVGVQTVGQTPSSLRWPA